MNNKGFSLIEMLATVVILGVLGTIAVVGTTKYINQSRKKAYVVMSQSIYEAAMNCQTKGNCTTGKYESDELMKKGYIDELKNPISKNNQCFGYVNINESDPSKEYKKYYEEFDIDTVFEYIDETLREYTRIAINMYLKDKTLIELLKK